MRERREVPLSTLTTLRLGGPARRLVEVSDPVELVDVVAGCDAAGEPVLVLGGGSNVVVADAGFDGTVVAVRTTGTTADVDPSSGAMVTVAAGEDWDDVVAAAVVSGWVGIEALAGVPGRCGAVPIQNVGAYGQEVSQTIASVRTYDRSARRQVTLAAVDCDFGYRTSRFKREPERFLVLDVTFQLRLGYLSAPVAYGELARRLGVELGCQAPLAEVRDAVLDLRRSKGMVLAPRDHDTWSAGSFFTNPILAATAADLLPAQTPRWPQPDGTVKTSAAWLIEQAGFGCGYGSGSVRLSNKHPLALSNRGGATTDELLALARKVRDRVRECFGVELVAEPVTVGCQL